MNIIGILCYNLLQDGKEGTKMQKILIVEDDEKLRNELAILPRKRWRVYLQRN